MMLALLSILHLFFMHFSCENKVWVIGSNFGDT